jgi:GNAT superfamily N-acetyltransferase
MSTHGAGPGAPAARVRAARREDLPRIWDMLLGLADYERLRHEVVGTREQLGEHLFGQRPLVECLVAESGAGLVGYALFFPVYSSFHTAPTLWLEDLFVEPAERGRGCRPGSDGGARSPGTGAWLPACRLAGARLERILDCLLPALGRPAASPDWIEYGLDRDALRALAESGPILDASPGSTGRTSSTT